MMRAAVALLASISLLGCFPHNPKARTYAKIAEGSAIVAGIAVSAFQNTGADCDEMMMIGVDNSSCHTQAKWLTTAGVVLIVGGLLGFVATVSTAEEDKTPPKPLELTEEETAKPATIAKPTGKNAPPSDPSTQGAPAPAPQH